MPLLIAALTLASLQGRWANTAGNFGQLYKLTLEADGTFLLSSLNNGDHSGSGFAWTGQVEGKPPRLRLAARSKQDISYDADRPASPQARPSVPSKDKFTLTVAQPGSRLLLRFQGKTIALVR